MTQPTYLTRDGLAKLKEELELYRTVKRQEVAERIQLANAIGGTVDNADYDEAKKEQAFIEGHIMDLENIINTASIIENAKGPVGVVKVGSKVTVLNQARDKKEKFHIVGSPEADPAAGRISNVSPIGKAILGKRVGQVAEVKVPAGVLKLKILEIH